ncbi:MAG: NAD(P)H-dependent oxidoreductase subunit E [Bryobacterales bacterium]|nr:NAD(P)H-dependent oxidoreductase subunit E [Bryobacterales bacterium]
MSVEIKRRTAVAAARAALTLTTLCVLALTADYIVARVRAPGDDARILELQKQVQGDASFAPKLAAAHDAMTLARRARKVRGDWISLLLIASAAAFIAGSKWVIALDAGNRPPAAKLVQIEPSPPAQTAAPPPKPAKEAGAAEPDLSMVDTIVAREGRSQEAAISILQAIQEHYRYLPDAALARVCEITDIRPAQIAGTSSFYSRFRHSPVGRHIVRVCHGTACHVSGARPVTEELRRQLRIPEGADTDPERMFTIEEVACLGCCSLAPVLMVDEHTSGKLTPATAYAALDAVAEKESA